MARIKRIWRRICNVFTNEIENRYTKEIEAVIVELGQALQEGRVLYDTIVFLKENDQAYKKEMLQRGKYIQELNKELSKLSIDYFFLYDERDKMIRVMEKFIPGKVDII